MTPTALKYVIRAKCISQQLVQMVNASSGRSEAERSDDGLSNFDGSDISDDAGVAPGEFSNVANNLNNAAVLWGGC